MIYLMRHGLDDERYIGGWCDVGLIWLGREQVKDAISFMKEYELKFNKIITSDVKRAKETAYMVAEAFGVEIIEDKRLRELNKGKLNGIMKVRSEVECPGVIRNLDIHTVYPDGESQISFVERFDRDIPDVFKEDDCLYIGHRGNYNELYRLQSGDPIHLDKEKYGVTHGSIHVYDRDTGQIKRIYNPETRKRLEKVLKTEFL